MRSSPGRHYNASISLYSAHTGAIVGPLLLLYTWYITLCLSQAKKKYKSPSQRSKKNGYQYMIYYRRVIISFCVWEGGIVNFNMFILFSRHFHPFPMFERDDLVRRERCYCFVEGYSIHIRTTCTQCCRRAKTTRLFTARATSRLRVGSGRVRVSGVPT